MVMPLYWVWVDRLLAWAVLHGGWWWELRACYVPSEQQGEFRELGANISSRRGMALGLTKCP